MEEQYRDYFGNPITKKEYKEQMDYKKDFTMMELLRVKN